MSKRFDLLSPEQWSRWLKELLADQGLRQGRLADATGVLTAVSLSRIKTGSRHLDEYEREALEAAIHKLTKDDTISVPGIRAAVSHPLRVDVVRDSIPDHIVMIQAAERAHGVEINDAIIRVAGENAYPQAHMSLCEQVAGGGAELALICSPETNYPTNGPPADLMKIEIPANTYFGYPIISRISTAANEFSQSECESLEDILGFCTTVRMAGLFDGIQAERIWFKSRIERRFFLALMDLYFDFYRMEGQSPRLSKEGHVHEYIVSLDDSLEDQPQSPGETVETRAGFLWLHKIGAKIGCDLMIGDGLHMALARQRISPYQVLLTGKGLYQALRSERERIGKLPQEVPTGLHALYEGAVRKKIYSEFLDFWIKVFDSLVLIVNWTIYFQEQNLPKARRLEHALRDSLSEFRSESWPNLLQREAFIEGLYTSTFKGVLDSERHQLLARYGLSAETTKDEEERRKRAFVASFQDCYDFDEGRVKERLELSREAFGNE